jgi:hypothetical protein
MCIESQQRSGDGLDVLTIKDLIRAALDNGKTVRQLETDSGGRVRFQAFQEYSNNAPKNFPRDMETITGMAIALGVSETTIVLAYAKGLGVRVAPGSAFSLRVPPGVDQLDHPVQESLLGLMRSIVRMEAAAAGTSSEARKEKEDSARDELDNRAGPNIADFVESDDPGVDGTEDGEQGHGLAGG